MAIWGNNNTIPNFDEDYSPSSTIMPFDSPKPLLRIPIAENGSFVLAFRNADSWRSAFESTKSKFMDQCMAGVRVGCSISASNKCKPPWWKSLFGVSAEDYAERQKCEERETETCLAASRESCIQFVKEKCLPAFRDARIVSTKVTTYRGSTLLDNLSNDSTFTNS